MKERDTEGKRYRKKCDILKKEIQKEKLQKGDTERTRYRKKEKRERNEKERGGKGKKEMHKEREKGTLRKRKRQKKKERQKAFNFYRSPSFLFWRF